MDSDSDVEIISAPLARSLQPVTARPAPAPASTALVSAHPTSLSSSPVLPPPTYARNDPLAGPSKTRIQVHKVEAIYLDSDEDDSVLPPEFRIDRSHPPTSTSSQPLPSSDLPAPSNLFTYPLPSTSTLLRAHSTSAALPRPSSILATLDRLSTTALLIPDKGKGKALVLSSEDEDEDEEEDLYDSMRAKGRQTGKRRRGYVSASETEDEGMEKRGKKGKVVVVGTKKREKKSEEEREREKREKKEMMMRKAEMKRLEVEEKKAFVEVNRIRKDKCETVKECTVLAGGTSYRVIEEDEEEVEEGRGKKKRGKSLWPAIVTALRVRLKQNECPVVEEKNGKEDAGSEGTIRWTRLCDRRWDDVNGCFEPLGEGREILVEEDTRIIFLTALDLSRHVASSSLLKHIESIKAQLPDHINMILLIHGLNSLCNSMRNAANALHRAQVRATLDSENVELRQTKGVGIGKDQPGKEELEMAIMRVQATLKCQIVTTEKETEAVDWLEQLTFDISLKPYHRGKNAHMIALGTADAKIVSGKGMKDTYIKILTSLKGVTEGAAKAIVAEYPSIRELYEAWEEIAGLKEKREMLVGISKLRNVNGTTTDRTIGKSMSAAIYDVMNGLDPEVFL